MKTRKTKNLQETAINIAIFALKLLIAFALVAWLYRQGLLDFSPLRDVTLEFNTVTVLLAGGASMSVALLLLGWRLQLLMRHRHFDLPLGSAVMITFISYFLGAALPGHMGADAVKAAYLCTRIADRRMDAFTTIAFDRVVGLYALLLLGSIALTIAWIGGVWYPGWSFLLLAPLLLAVISLTGLIFTRIGVDERGPYLEYALSRIPWRIKVFLSGFHTFMRDPGVMFRAVLISLLSHVFMVLSFVATAIVIKDSLPVFMHFVINPLAVTFNSVPVSPGGLGITESAFAYLFQSAGSENGALIGLLGRALQYGVYALGGGIALLCLRWRSETFRSLKQSARH